MQTRTKRQREVLDYITGFVDRNGYGPSYQQIARHLGVSSKAGVQRHIMALENLGLVARKRQNGSFIIELPMRRAAVESACVVDHFEVPDPNKAEFKQSVITLPRFMIGPFSPEEIFAFTAPDESLEEKGLCPGDLLLAEKRNFARRGDVGVFMVKGMGMMMGLYYPQGPETEIRYANDDFDPLSMPSDEVEIKGVMRGFVRPIPSPED